MVCPGPSEVFVTGNALLQDGNRQKEQLGAKVESHLLENLEHHALWVLLEEFVHEDVDVLLILEPLLN